MPAHKDIEGRKRFAYWFVRLNADKKNAAEKARVPIRTVYNWFQDNDELMHSEIEAQARALKSEILVKYAQRALERSDRAAEYLLSAWDENLDPQARKAKIEAQGRISAAMVEANALDLRDIRAIIDEDPMLLGEPSDSVNLETSDKKTYRSIDPDAQTIPDELNQNDDPGDPEGGPG